MNRAKSSFDFPKVAERGVHTTLQLLHFQRFAQIRVRKPTVGHVPCTFLIEMCV